MFDKIKATLGLVFYKEKAKLKAALESLCEQTALDRIGEVLSVQNGNCQETLRHAKAFEGRLPLTIFPRRPNHIGQARALIVEKASFPLIAFTDADCLLPPDWLERLLNHWTAAAVLEGTAPLFAASEEEKTAKTESLLHELSAEADQAGWEEKPLQQAARRRPPGSGKLIGKGGFATDPVASGGDPARSAAAGKASTGAQHGRREDSAGPGAKHGGGLFAEDGAGGGSSRVFSAPGESAALGVLGDEMKGTGSGVKTETSAEGESFADLRPPETASLDDSLQMLAGVGGPNRLPERTFWQKLVNLSLSHPLGHGWSPQAYIPPKPAAVSHLAAGNALFSVKKIREAGNFSTDWRYRRTGEDLDLGLRLNNPLYLFPDPVVVNDHSSSFAQSLFRLFRFGLTRKRRKDLLLIPSLLFAPVLSASLAAAAYPLFLSPGTAAGVFKGFVLSAPFVLAAYFAVLSAGALQVFFQTRKILSLLLVFVWPLSAFFYSAGAVSGLFKKG